MGNTYRRNKATGCFEPPLPDPIKDLEKLNTDDVLEDTIRRRNYWHSVTASVPDPENKFHGDNKEWEEWIWERQENQ